MTGTPEQLLDWDRRMGRHSRFPPCCIDEWCANMVEAKHDVNSLHLFGVAAEKRVALGPVLEKQIKFVPCWACIHELVAGKMVPPLTHRCKATDPECEALWAEAERLTGYKRWKV